MFKIKILSPNKSGQAVLDELKVATRSKTNSGAVRIAVQNYCQIIERNSFLMSQNLELKQQLQLITEAVELQAKADQAVDEWLSDNS